MARIQNETVFCEWHGLLSKPFLVHHNTQQKAICLLWYKHT